VSPANLLNRLQSVLNTAGPSVAGLRRSDHITDTLASGCVHLNESGLNWQSLFTEVYTALHSVSVWSATAHCWHHIKTPSPVVNLLWTGHPSVTACNRRWSIICCCRPQALEHSAWGHYICAIFTGVPTKTEDSFVSAILSEHYCSLCGLLCPVVLEVDT